MVPAHQADEERQEIHAFPPSLTPVRSLQLIHKLRQSLR